MSTIPSRVPFAAGATSSLDHLGLIRVEGADAAGFLHAQLTTSVVDLEAGVISLTGYCSAKGRLIAIALLWRSGTGFKLLLARELIAALVKRLSQFVLRSKVEISDGSGEFGMLGYVGAAARALLEGHAPHLPGAPMTVRCEASLEVLCVPGAAGLERWIALGPAGEAAAYDALEHGLPQEDPDVWRWLDIRAGLPEIVLATQDRYVPQMLNLEALGGVDFKKGCYPGQEVVARSQYLGKLKRRMSGASIGAAGGVPAPGADIFAASGQPVGSVVAAAAAPGGGIDLLVELALGSMNEPLHLGAGAGAPALSLWPVPYPLPDNEVFVRPKL